MATALIAGATGLVGQALLPELLVPGRYARVLAVVRKPLRAADPRLEQIVVDFGQLPDLPVDDVYCAVGTTIRKAGSEAAFRAVDFDVPAALARMAKRNAARQFLLVSSVGASAQSGNFYLRVKGELEAAVRALGFESLHVFQPSFLLGERTESRPGERIGIAVAKSLGWAMVGPLAKYHAIDGKDLARAMVAAASRSQPGAFVHQYPF